MSMTGRLSCFLIAGLLGGTAHSAHADDAHPAGLNLELGLFGGVYMPDEEHELFDLQNSVHQPYKRYGLDGGLRLAFYPVSFLGLEVEGSAIYTRTRKPTEETVLLYSVRPSLVLQIPLRVTPFVFGGYGRTAIRTDDDVLGEDDDPVLHGGAGLKFFLGRRVHIRLDGRVYRTARLRGPGEDDGGMVNHYGATLGLGFHLGRVPTSISVGTDADGDGVADLDDRCPKRAGDGPDGCPRDPDGDRVLGAADRCPDDPETKNGHEDQDGCPDELPDADSDGIVGELDKCPEQAEDVDKFEDEDGCPELDNDQDELLDTADACPDEKGPAENKGCPDPDRDGDSIVDRLDNCPDEAGTAANQGCKKKQLVVLTQTQLKILDMVYFATGKARILRRSRRLLDNVAQVIKAHPEIEKVRIEGHTDDRGSDTANKVLSQKRADAVLEYLIGKGVPSERLEAIGYGEEKPIEDNSTKKGRAANRRVEFNIIAPAPQAGQGTP